jgi:hypothetical protein
MPACVSDVIVEIESYHVLQGFRRPLTVGGME